MRAHARFIILAALLACGLAGCQETLNLTSSGVQWLCVSDAQCGSGFVCSAQGVCTATAGGADVVSPGETRDCTRLCTSLNALASCDGGEVGEDTSCETLCPVVNDACFDCLEKVTCTSFDQCFLTTCLSDPCFLDPSGCTPVPVVTPDATSDTGPDAGPQPDASPDAAPHSDESFTHTDDDTGYVVLDGARYPVLRVYNQVDNILGDYIHVEFRCRGDVDALQIYLDSPAPLGSQVGRVRTYFPDGKDVEIYELASGVSGQTELWYTGSGTVSDLEGSGKTHTYEFKVTREELISGTLHFSSTSPRPIGTNEVLLDGYMTPSQMARIRHVVDSHPEIDTLVFGCSLGLGRGDVPGVGRAIRAAGLKTRLPGNALLSHAWLYIAGVTRTVDASVTLAKDGEVVPPGGSIFQVGPYNNNDGTSGDFSCPSDTFHAETLAYFRQMLPEPGATDFYCFSQSVPFRRRLSRAELVTFGIIAE